METTTEQNQNKLLKVLNELFISRMNEKNEREITINPDLNYRKLERLSETTRELILNLFITCEKDYKKVECGILAKNFLKNKIGDKIPSCITKDKDRYQRVVAECFIGNESLSRFMVREGYAVAYSQYSKDFVEDEKFAKENRLGIWSMSFQMPSDYRKASRNK